MSGWNPVTEKLREDLNRLQDELQTLIFTPKVKGEILQSLKENPNATQRDIAKKINPSNTWILHIAFWHAWNELEKSGEIVGCGHGRGKLKTWIVKEA